MRSKKLKLKKETKSLVSRIVINLDSADRKQRTAN
jgi:hypothetical protein